MKRLLNVESRNVDAMISIDDLEERATLKAAGFRWTGKRWTIEFPDYPDAQQAVVSMVRDRGYEVARGYSIARVADWLDQAGIAYEDMPVVAQTGLSGSGDMRRVPADFLKNEVERRRAKMATAQGAN